MMSPLIRQIYIKFMNGNSSSTIHQSLFTDVHNFIIKYRTRDINVYKNTEENKDIDVYKNTEQNKDIEQLVLNRY